jgi:hypothetical protein
MTTLRRRSCVLIAALTGSVAVATINATTSQTGSVISGKVVEGDARTPVPFAQIAVAPAAQGQSFDSRPAGRTIVAGADGTFAFENVNAGSYFLAAFKSGYVTVYYRGTGEAATSPGTPMTIAAGERRANIELRLIRGGVISGRITDQHGEPVMGAHVNWAAPRPQSAPQGIYFARSHSMGYSDARGMYRLYGLAPGEYVISATAHGEQLRLGASDGARVAYIPVYYPGVTDGARAEAVSVAVGAERPDINLTLQTAVLVTLAGTVALPPDVTPAETRIGLEAVVTGPIVGYTFVTINRRGEFEAKDVPPGDYVLVAYTEASASTRGSSPARYWATLPVTVHDRNVTGLSIALQRTMIVSGSAVATSDGSAPAADLARCTITLEPIGRAMTSHIPVDGSRFGADGGFAITNVMPGRYRFVTWMGGTRLQVSTAAIGNVPIGADGFEVVQGADVNRVVLTIRQ